MKTKLTLVVMAAGMGSRFGGLKQMTPVSVNGEFLIDYSLFDAVRSGFEKVVFVIRKELEEDFEKTIAKRIRPFIEVVYAYQEISDIPLDLELTKDRIKPWGTAHAIYAARKHVDGPFVVINADDFYGREAFSVAKEFLLSLTTDDTNHFALVAYQVAKTLSLYGSVKRGVCMMNPQALEALVESKIERNDMGELTCSPLDGKAPFIIKDEELVSMNFFAFTPRIFTFIEEGLKTFLANENSDYTTMEYHIPDVLTNLIWNNEAIISVLQTNDNWFGITYASDLPQVQKDIEQLISEKKYPPLLWKK